MPYQGVSVSTDGQQHVPSAIGPMARSLQSLTAVTKTVIETELWTKDAQLPPTPWKEHVFEDFAKRSLVIGIMPDDGVVKVHPPIERVFGDTVAKLQNAGHEIVPWDTSLNAHCIAIMVSPVTILSRHRSLTHPGRILYRRRRRRHPTSSRRRRRTLHPPRPSINRSCTSHISLRILATEQTKSRRATSLSHNVE